MELIIEKILSEESLVFLAIVSAILFLLLLINFILIMGLRKKLRMVTHNQEGQSIEAIINGYYSDIEKVQATQLEILSKQEEISKILQKCINRVSMVRFNPFKDVGGDQSFAIALLDRDNNGIVISSLYNRTNSRFYAKPIQGGSSDYPLTDEEVEAIEKAMGQKN